MARRTKQQTKQAELLQKLPAGAKYVLVINELGKKKYREITALAKSDEIQTTRQGIPIAMTKEPGRPARAPAAAPPANALVAELLKRKESVLRDDPILVAAKETPEDPDVLHQVILALGAEAASLGFEREEAERQGMKTSEISVRRVNTLKALADTWIKRKDQIVNKGIDLESQSFKSLFRFIMETFQEALDLSGVQSEMSETVFAKLTTLMNEDWEAEAKNRMRNTV
jgi:hypothetical protein